MILVRRGKVVVEMERERFKSMDKIKSLGRELKMKVARDHISNRKDTWRRRN
jgi:hypothetical protein